MWTHAALSRLFSRYAAHTLTSSNHMSGVEWAHAALSRLFSRYAAHTLTSSNHISGVMWAHAAVSSHHISLNINGKQFFFFKSEHVFRRILQRPKGQLNLTEQFSQAPKR